MNAETPQSPGRNRVEMHYSAPAAQGLEQERPIRVVAGTPIEILRRVEESPDLWLPLLLPHPDLPVKHFPLIEAGLAKVPLRPAAEFPNRVARRCAFQK